MGAKLESLDRSLAVDVGTASDGRRVRCGAEVACLVPLAAIPSEENGAQSGG